MSSDLPSWEAEATLVQLPPVGQNGEPHLRLEGTLAEAVQSLRFLSRQQLSRCRISLPNAHAQPRRFEGEALLELVQSAPVASGHEIVVGLASRSTRKS